MDGRSPSPVLPHANAADRRLVAYALATGAAAVPAADGAIVYTAVNQTVSWSATGDSIAIDVDGSGVDDFRIGWSINGQEAVMSGLNGSLVLVSGISLRPFAFGDIIADGESSSTSIGKQLAGYSPSAPFEWTGGTWGSGASSYAGFQLDGISGRLGWMYLTVPTAATTGSVITVHGYAYETVAEQSIVAGAVPAPGALLTLALGAVGIRGRRARAA